MPVGKESIKPVNACGPTPPHAITSLNKYSPMVATGYPTPQGYWTVVMRSGLKTFKEVDCLIGNGANRLEGSMQLNN
jgi:hypothetical protein